MGHTCQEGSHWEKWAKLTEKGTQLSHAWKKGQTGKNRCHFEIRTSLDKWVTFGKWVTLGNIGHTLKNGYTWKNGSHLEKWVYI